MGYTVKGEFDSYSFADDVPYDKALEYIKLVDKPAKWSDVMEAVVPTAQAAGAKTFAGLKALAGDVFGQQEWVDEASQVQKAIEEHLKEVTPRNLTFAQESVLGGTSSAIAVAPYALGGLGFGATKLGLTAALARPAAVEAAITSGAELGLLGMSAGEGLSRYGELRSEGFSPVRSAAHAAVQAAAEYFPEKLPLKTLLSYGKNGALKTIAKALGYDVAGEQVTTLIEDINAKLSDRPDMTLADYLKDAAVTAGATVISGPLQALGVGLPTAAVRGIFAPKAPKPADTPQKALPNAEPSVVPKLTEEPPEEPPAVEPESPSGFTPKEKRQTGYVLGENGELTPEFESTKPPALLPVEQRIMLLKSILDTPPGPTATAEDLIARRAKVAELRASLERDAVVSPEARAKLYEVDQELGITIPDWGKQLEVEELQSRGLIEHGVMRAHAEAPPVFEDVTFTPTKDAVNDFAYKYGAAGETLGNVPSREDTPKFRLQTNLQTYDFAMQNNGLNMVYSTDGAQYANLSNFVETAPNGTVAVFGEANTMLPKEVQNLLTTSLASWTRQFLPHMKFALVSAADQAQFRDDRATSWYSMLPNSAGFIAMPFTPNVITAHETLAHEFEHAIIAEEFKKASPQTKAAIFDEYYQALKDGATMPAKEFFNKYFAPERAKYFVDNAPPGMTGAQAYFHLMNARQPATRTYFMSFNEYLAESGAKYFFSRAGFTPEASDFFKRMIKAIATFFKSAASTLPPQSFAKWMDSIAARNAPIQLGPVREIKDALRAAGVQEPVLAVFEDPGTHGFDTDLAQKFLENDKSRKDRIGQMMMFEGRTWYRIPVAISKLRAATKDSRISPKTADAILRETFEADKPQWLSEIWLQPEFRGRSRINKYEIIKWLYDNIAPIDVVDVPNNPGVVALVSRLTKRMIGAFEYSARLTDKGEVYWSLRFLPSEKLYNTKAVPHDGAIKEDWLSSADESLRMVYKTALMREAARRGHNLVSIQDSLEKIPLWMHPSDYAAGEAASFHLAVDDLVNRLGMQKTALGSLPNDIVKFNNILKIGLGAFQMAKLNAHVPGVIPFRTALRNSMMYRAEWLRPANDIIEQWLYKMPRDEAAKVSRLLFDEARRADAATSPQQMQDAWFSTYVQDPNKPNEYIFHLKPGIAKKYGLSEKGQEVYSKVRNFYMMALDEMERVGVGELARLHFHDPVVSYSIQEAMRQKASTQTLRMILEGFAQKDPATSARLAKDIDELQSQFAELRAKPYTPYPRFGQWAVMVKNPQTGRVLYFSTHASQQEQAAEYAEVKADPAYKDMAVSMTYLESVPYMLQGMPPKLLDALQNRLELTPEQVQAYKELLKDMTSSQAFARRMKRRKGVEGFTEDAISGFADYARRYANHLSRTKADVELQDALKQLEDYAKSLESKGDTSATNARRLHEWLEQTRMYLRNPGNELGEVKSLVTMFYLGGNLSSAVVNALQVPFVTLPYLSERFGVARTTAELTKAYKDVVQSWGKLDRLSPEEQAMFDHGLSSYFLDESFAATLAQIQDGGALQRAQPLTHARRAFTTVNHYAMKPFQLVEGLNRRVTMLAAYRMARSENFRGAFDREAYEFAREVVESTQNEYAPENRPVFMRGNKSVVFQFMHFTQNMIFQMFGGDPSWKRLLLTQLAVAGLMGLPFASDISDLIKFLAKKWGIDFEPEYEARKFLTDLNVNADLILRGLTSDVFGFDLSRRVSLGEVIPGVRAATSNQKFNDALAMAAGDVGGAGFSILLNLLKFVGDDSPDTWRRWQYVMPSAIRNVMKAVDAELSGGVTDKKGALLADTDIFDNIGMAVGFMPEQVSKKYQSVTTSQEIANYWTHRREVLLNMWTHVHTDRDGSREDVADVLDRIQAYNASAPDPKLTITRKTLRAAATNALKSRTMRELGLGSNPQTRAIASEVSAAFAE